MDVGDDDVETVVLDPSFTEKSFNWKSRIPFEKIIQNQLQWYEKFGIRDVYSHLQIKG